MPILINDPHKRISEKKPETEIEAPFGIDFCINENTRINIRLDDNKIVVHKISTIDDEKIYINPSASNCIIIE